MPLNPEVELSSKHSKLCRPYQEPYRILKLSKTSTLIRPISESYADNERVPIARLFSIPNEVSERIV